MNHLHIAIIEDFDECIVDYTQEGLREQVSDSLTKKSLRIPTDEEWEVCVEAAVDEHVKVDCDTLAVILYYKILSKLVLPIVSAV